MARRPKYGRVEHGDEVLDVFSCCRGADDTHHLEVHADELAPVATGHRRGGAVPAPVEVVDPMMSHHVVDGNGDRGDRRFHDVVEIDDGFQPCARVPDHAKHTGRHPGLGVDY